MNKNALSRELASIEEEQAKLKEKASAYRDKEQKYRFLKRGALAKLEALEGHKNRIKYAMD